MRATTPPMKNDAQPGNDLTPASSAESKLSNWPDGKELPEGSELLIGDEVVLRKGEKVSDEEFRARVARASQKVLEKIGQGSG